MKRPLVHCITNSVTSSFVADTVVALGGRPIMSEDPDECAFLAQKADMLVVNLGQLTAAKKQAILAALKARQFRPWLLDPVGIGYFASRLTFARELLAFKPSQIRGNASEIWSLATGNPSGSGTDSDLTVLQGSEIPNSISESAEVCITQAGLAVGKRDLCIKDKAEVWHSGGTPIMGEMAGFGCALSAATAVMQSGSDALWAFGLAGRRASNARFGDFRSAFLSELSIINREIQAREMLQFYFVAGPQDCADLPEVLERALISGVTAFQYRPKGVDFPVALTIGRKLRKLCAQAGVPFIVNDSLDMALELDADGLHLGQGDGDVRSARSALGMQSLIGLSVSSDEHWDSYVSDCVDYVGLGPFAYTATKRDNRLVLGKKGLVRLKSRLPEVPTVAIGGIGLDNLSEALSSGVDGIAVVSAISKASNPEIAATEICKVIRSHFVN